MVELGPSVVDWSTFGGRSQVPCFEPLAILGRYEDLDALLTIVSLLFLLSSVVEGRVALLASWFGSAAATGRHLRLLALRRLRAHIEDHDLVLGLFQAGCSLKVALLHALGHAHELKLDTGLSLSSCPISTSTLCLPLLQGEKLGPLSGLVSFLLL